MATRSRLMLIINLRADITENDVYMLITRKTHNMYHS